MDGHHRLSASLLRGEGTADVWLLDLDDVGSSRVKPSPFRKRGQNS